MPLHVSNRRMLLASAVLVAAVSIVLAAWVIPPVTADVFALATPTRAARAFWAVVVMNFIGATLLGRLAGRRSHGMAGRRILGIVVGVVLLLIALSLVNAAVSFQAHGAAMRHVSVLLFGCVAAEGIAGVLATIGVLMKAPATP